MSSKHISAKTEPSAVPRPHDCSMLSDKLTGYINLPKVDFSLQIKQCWGDRVKSTEESSSKACSGEKDVSKLLTSVTPLVEDGLFVFTTSPDAKNCEGVKMIFHEREAATVILPLDVAKLKGLEYTFPSKLITLNIHSSLEAVGFITEISRKLTDLKIPCNVVAGYYHDHLFVPEPMLEDALSVFPNFKN
ncbi:Oidioi.mRNA.OKI2018_I69.PAR.g9555.t1.cds [Oikopleura dioica]|uniref:Oidioi.mRNA.OKI2018_I69.PAR.g9555.t1.cds n=1 Tax=Oikopleura dioica TaxID=34765 RepID=A0ABN7RLB6_OIKDI|nr:Oidioi.mRNA.OKI2018_I69.PAR.g9555.t1.cds [Oikopleura dioica]